MLTFSFRIFSNCIQNKKFSCKVVFLSKLKSQFSHPKKKEKLSLNGWKNYSSYIKLCEISLSTAVDLKSLGFKQLEVFSVALNSQKNIKN